MKTLYLHLYLCFIACVVGFIIFQFMEINDVAAEIRQNNYNTQSYERDSLHIDSTVVAAMPINRIYEGN